MSSKEDALQEIVTLARNNGLSAADITAALQAGDKGAGGGILSKLFSYFGGIFIFSGLCIITGMYWDTHLTSATRVLLTLGTGFALFIMAVTTLADKRYTRAATPLFLASAIFQPTGIFVMLKEYGHGGDPRHGVLFMAVIMLIQHGMTFWAKRRTTLAFTSVFFGSVLFATVCDILDIPPNLSGTVFGTATLCIAYALGQSRHAAIAGFWHLIGALILLASVFDAVEGTPWEVAFIGVSSLMIFISTLARSRALLFISSLATLCYIGYFTSENFARTLGWPVALIICGLALLGMGAFAMRLDRKYIRR